MLASRFRKQYQVIPIPLVFVQTFYVSHMKSVVFPLKGCNGTVSFFSGPGTHPIQFPSPQKQRDEAILHFRH